MKIRTGFVSNSSSSSFCCFGFLLSEEESELIFKDLAEFEHKYWIDKDLNISYTDCNGSYKVLGVFENFHDDDLVNIPFNIKIVEKLNEIKNKYNLKGEISLISGTFYS